MLRVWRVLGRSVAVLLVLAMLSPWLAYEAILLGIEGRPTRPVPLASVDQQAAVWQLARGHGPLRVESLNPYGFVWRFFSAEVSGTPGETLAYWVAREHIWAQPRRSMLWWHASNAALTIWLTRHWSGEELASAALPVLERELKYRNRRAAEPEPDDQTSARSRAASAL